MADSTGSGTPPSVPPEDMHWGFSYLREDIQDLRQEFRGQIQDLRDDIRGARQETQEVRKDLTGQIQATREELSNQIQATREEVKELAKRMDSRFYLTMTMMIGMTAAIIGSMKL